MVQIAALLLILAAPAPATPFDPPPPGSWGLPGVRARFAESLNRLAARLDKNPSDAAALARLFELNRQLGRAQRLIEVSRKALADDKLEKEARARIRGVLGLAIVAEVDASGGFGNFFIIVNGRVIQQGRELTDDQRKLFVEAEGHLRAAIEHDGTNADLRDALAEVVEGLRGDPEKGDKEVDALREQAASIRLRRAAQPVPDDPFQKKATELLGEASSLEQKEKDPDHVRALELRKQALVLAFARDTIVFEYSAPLYEPVSLLAPGEILNEYLTRSYRTSEGNAGFVAPTIHVTPYPKRREIIAALGRDRTKAADAVLIALVRGASAPQDLLAGAAMEALGDGAHDGARAGLPLLLAKALFSVDESRFPIPGQCLLVELAVRLDCKAAADVLVACLPRDDSLHWPRRVAWAAGRLGTRAHAPQLLAVARDAGRDIAFRREAARACARLDPESAAALASDADLAIALAAAKYEATKDENAKGRILNGFANDDEIDEAARYCAELGIREAAPALEKFLARYGEKNDHPARLVVQRALAELNRAP